MNLPTFTSGLAGTAADAAAFVGGVSFARPGWALVAFVPIVMAGIGRWTRPRADAIGRPAAVLAQITGPRPAGRWAVGLGWLLLAVGLAGPGWGTGEGGVAVGRDVVIVLDLSRSMLAADTADPATRWQTGVAAARDLVAATRDRGGHRVGVVVFAARPYVLVPLTTDADHVDAALADLDGEFPPPAVRPGTDPGPASGTRIGSALAAAVAAHDPRFPNARDVVLITDGDDPAGDREWAAGVSAARAAGVPVHVVGIGDPDRDSPIVIDGEPLAFPGPGGVPAPVRTRMRDAFLRELAVEARGEYLPAGRTVPPLGEFWRARIEPLTARQLTDDAVPQPRDRSAWFYAAAAGFLFLGWWRGR